MFPFCLWGRSEWTLWEKQRQLIAGNPAEKIVCTPQVYVGHSPKAAVLTGKSSTQRMLWQALVAGGLCQPLLLLTVQQSVSKWTTSHIYRWANRLFEFELWVFFRSEAFWYFCSISWFAFKTHLALCFAWYSINYHKMKPVLTSVWQTVHSQWRIPQVWRLACCWVYWVWLEWSL